MVILRFWRELQNMVKRSQMLTGPPPSIGGYWEGFAFAKFGIQVLFQQFLPMDRNPSAMDLIHLALGTYGGPDIDWVMVNVSDRDDFDWILRRRIAEGWVQGDDGRIHALLSFCTSQRRFEFVIPDFIYDHWRSTGLDDYEATAQRFAHIGHAQTNQIGWRGADTHDARKALVALNDANHFDFAFVHWDRSNEQQLRAPNFMSLEAQVQRWRYLLDVEGNGYSARTKLLLRAPRVVFIQERPYLDDAWVGLTSWRHYVPVKRDFSDLVDNYQRLRSDPELEQLILNSARDFANAFLTRASALQRIAWTVRVFAEAQKLSEEIRNRARKP